MSLEAISGASGIRRLVALGALALYAASLWLPVATTTLVSEQVIPGYEILVTGFLGAFDGQFAWYANPLMIWSMAWLFTRRRVSWVGVVMSLVMLGLALSAFTWARLPTDAGYYELTGRAAGFYLWIASAGLLWAAMIVLFVRDNSPDTKAG
jgi:hypothetical protein